MIKTIKNNKIGISPRTDMAVEFIKNVKSKKLDKDLVVTDVSLDDKLSKRLNRPVGRYVTIETSKIRRRDSNLGELTEKLAQFLSDVIPDISRLLVVGLGNPFITADSLGKAVCDKLVVGELKNKARYALTPSVMGLTGIESFDIISAVVKKIKPTATLVVDSLAAASCNRIASAFQISSSGITPGSGVSNHRVTINSSSLGCPVIAIGVPLVVYVSTIVGDITGEDKPLGEFGDMIVTPKDIDLFIDSCSFAIASAINSL